MAKIEVTFTFDYTPEPGSDAYEDCSDLAECFEVDEDVFKDDPVEFITSMWDAAEGGREPRHTIRLDR